MYVVLVRDEVNQRLQLLTAAANWSSASEADIISGFSPAWRYSSWLPPTEFVPVAINHGASCDVPAPSGGCVEVALSTM